MLLLTLLPSVLRPVPSQPYLLSFNLQESLHTSTPPSRTPKALSHALALSLQPQAVNG